MPTDYENSSGWRRSDLSTNGHGIQSDPSFLLTVNTRWRFYAVVKTNSAPACRGLQLSGFDRLSSLPPTMFTASSRCRIRYIVLIALSCVAAIAMLPGLSSAGADTSPPSPPAHLALGLEPWSGESKPEFNLERLRGGRDQLSLYKHRIVLVHFFATWCANCHDGIAALQRLTEQVNDQSIVVLAIDVADLDLRARRYFEKNRVNFPVLLDRDRETAKAWDVYSLPATFILDKSLTVKYWTETSPDWSQPEIVKFLHDLASR